MPLTKDDAIGILFGERYRLHDMLETAPGRAYLHEDLAAYYERLREALKIGAEELFAANAREEAIADPTNAEAVALAKLTPADMKVLGIIK